MKVSRKLGRRRTLRNRNRTQKRAQKRAQKRTHKRGKRFHRGGVNSPVLLKYKKNGFLSTEESKHFEIRLLKQGMFSITLQRVEKPITLTLYCGSLSDTDLTLPDLKKVVAIPTNSYDFSFADNASTFNDAFRELQAAHQEQRQKQDQQKQDQQKQQQQQQQQQQQSAEAVDKMKKLEEYLNEIPDTELIIGLFSTPQQDDTPVNFSVFKKTQEELASSIKRKIDEDTTSGFSKEEKDARKRRVDVLLDAILKSQKKLMLETYLVVKGYDTISADIRNKVAEKLYKDYLVNNLKTDTPERLANIKQNVDSMQKTASKETVVNINPTDRSSINPLYGDISRPDPNHNRTPPGCTTETAMDYQRSYGSLNGWVPCDPMPEATEHYGPGGIDLPRSTIKYT